MKKFIIALFLLTSLTACEGTTKTIVVDQSGKVLETKNEFSGLVLIRTVPIDGMIDGNLYQDTTTGCEYYYAGHSFTPYYNAKGVVDGCKEVTNK